MALEVFAQCRFRLGYAVLHQRQRGAHELRVARCVADGLRVGAIGGLAHFQRRVVIAERAPGVGQRRHEEHRPLERRDGLFPAAHAPEREALQRQRIRLVGHHLEHLRGLLGRGRGRGIQQPRRVGQRGVEAAGGLDRVHWLTTQAHFAGFLPVPARSLMSRYQISRPS
jgi:hypothetical protein